MWKCLRGNGPDHAKRYWKSGVLMDICLRWKRKNAFSLAALAPLLPSIRRVKTPTDGIMIYSLVTRQAASVFREVQNATTNSIFIAGGPHPSGDPEGTLRYFDYVVIGEGEATLPELVKVLQEGGNVSTVKGIAYKDTEGKIIYTPKREPIELDDYPCFDPHLIKAPIEISRGCPWKCKYCQIPQMFGSKVRHRSIDSIVKCAQHYKDLRFISSNSFAYGSDGIHPRFDKVEKLLEALYAIGNKDIYFGTFPSEVRPEFVTDESLEMVNKYCTNDRISLGAQSGSERVLRDIHRGHTVREVEIAVERCFEHGITPTVDFILGFPDETQEEQEMSLELIQWICSKGGEVRAHYLEPLPGTPYAHVSPSKVSEKVNSELGKLALNGKITGSWE